MSWFSAIKSNWQQKKLTRPECACMFTEPRPNEWVAIDCEMTGLNPKKNHILSVAAIHVNGNSIDSGKGLHLVCRPPEMPSQETIVIHGLRPSDVEHGISYDDMLAVLLPFINNRPIVGFFPQIDVAFLNPLVKNYMGTALPNHIIDIRTMYDHKKGYRAQGVSQQGLSLAKILQAFEIPELGHHDAYNDALMTALAFLHLK